MPRRPLNRSSPTDFKVKLEAILRTRDRTVVVLHRPTQTILPMNSWRDGCFVLCLHLCCPGTLDIIPAADNNFPPMSETVYARIRDDISNGSLLARGADDSKKEEISKYLKTRKSDHSTIKDNEEDPEVCSICLDNLLCNSNNMVATLDCGHEFHAVCIKSWLARKNVCPLCKRTALAISHEEQH